MEQAQPCRQGPGVEGTGHLADAKRNLDRQKMLWEGLNVLQILTDRLRPVVAGGEADANVLQAQASLKKVETDLGYTRIYSPVDGIVVSRDVDGGQTVAVSFQTPTLIAQDLPRCR